MLKYSDLPEIDKEKYRKRLLTAGALFEVASGLSFLLFFVGCPLSFIGAMLLAQYDYYFDDMAILISQIFITVPLLFFPLSVFSFIIHRAYILPKKDQLYAYHFKKVIATDIFSKEFEKESKQKIGNNFDDIEKLRLKKLKTILIVNIVMFLILAVVFIKSERLDILIYYYLPVFGLLYSTAILCCGIKTYQTFAKNRLLEYLLTVIGEAEKAWLLKDEEIEFLKTINIFGEFNDYKLDDGFNLVYNDIYIQVRELCLSRKTVYEDKTSINEPVYNGLYIKIPCSRKFNGITVVNSSTVSEFSRLQSVTLESQKFNDYYRVESTDQIEARYLLTPAFMERLIYLKETTLLRKSVIIFKNGYINVLVPSFDDYFEVPIFKSIKDVSSYRTILIHLLCILSIPETLKLK